MFFERNVFRKTNSLQMTMSLRGLRDADRRVCTNLFRKINSTLVNLPHRTMWLNFFFIGKVIS
ncbi:hypothetical protein Hanom_Chr03g00251901 [Helianthus anomalus]